MREGGCKRRATNQEEFHFPNTPSSLQPCLMEKHKKRRESIEHHNFQGVNFIPLALCFWSIPRTRFDATGSRFQAGIAVLLEIVRRPSKVWICAEKPFTNICF